MKSTNIKDKKSLPRSNTKTKNISIQKNLNKYPNYKKSQSLGKSPDLNKMKMKIIKHEKEFNSPKTIDYSKS